jgi:uncharacterized protein YdaU (DUF1376 family)
MSGSSTRTPFVKWYTDDWIAGTIDLTFEEKGFYFELLIRMWERKDHLPNDERWISCALGCNPRTVRKLLAALIAKGKIVINAAGCVANNRMMREISTHLHGKSSPNSEPIQDELGSNSAGTQPKTQAKSTTQKSIPEAIQKEKKTTSSSASRGSRLPNDWALPDDWFEWTRVTFPGSTAEQVRIEGLKFANYWTAIPGAKGCKANWKRTWQNRCYDVFATAPMRPRAGTSAPRQPNRPSLSDIAGAFMRLEDRGVI